MKNRRAHPPSATMMLLPHRAHLPSAAMMMLPHRAHPTFVAATKNRLTCLTRLEAESCRSQIPQITLNTRAPLLNTTTISAPTPPGSMVDWLVPQHGRVRVSFDGPDVSTGSDHGYYNDDHASTVARLRGLNIPLISFSSLCANVQA